MIVTSDMAGETVSKHRRDVAIVVIGRNEGDRLRRCLTSIAGGLIAGGANAVYVDSGSTDGSVEQASMMGVKVIALPVEQDHSAARGRNAGLVSLDDPAPAYVQMIDGDCALDPGWIDHALSVIEADPGIVAVFGRRREVAPDRSIYNRLCDIEWAVPPGEASAFGGDVLLRYDAVRAAQGYREDMIAGEDIDLALRLRQAGGRIRCVPAEMTRHDAAIGSFGAWWRRTARAGHAFAELAARHPEAAGAPYRTSVRRIHLWGGALPAIALTGLVAGFFAVRFFWIPAAAIMLIIAQMLRITAREARSQSWPQAVAVAWFLTIGKYAELTGLLRFRWIRIRGGQARLIEYKHGTGR